MPTDTAAPLPLPHSLIRRRSVAALLAVVAGSTAVVAASAASAAAVPTSAAAGTGSAATPPPPGARFIPTGSPAMHGRADIVQTTADLQDALTVKPPRRFGASAARGAQVIDVDPAVRYQRIVGFGGAMTDSSAWLLYDELSPAERQLTMEGLFGRQGIHLDYVRIPMGATDFTVGGRPYTYDDLPPGQTDPGLAHFSVAHDDAYIVPALREMLQLNPRIFTLATPWTPPPWMKANDAYDNQKLAGTVLPQDYPAWAAYFVKFLQAYRARGIPIDAITMMNEPHSLSSWPGSAFSAAAQAQWLPQFLAPALAAARLRPAIFGLDDTEVTDAETLLNSAAGSHVTGLAVHCYQGMASMSLLHAVYQNKRILEDECAPGIIPYTPAEVAIDATRNWASGVQLWNLALDPAGGPVQMPNFGCGGCSGIVTVNEATHTTTFGAGYYQLGQLSKYVLPGAVRIDSTRLVWDYQPPAGRGVSRGVDDVAFINPDGSKVLVAYNSAPLARAVAVHYGGRYLNWTVPAGATVTFVWS